MSLRVAVGVSFIALVALESCTTVLGMERATLDETGSTALKSSRPCAEPPSDGCSVCLEQKCGVAYSSCFGDTGCRGSLDRYAICVGDTCGGNPTACASKLDASLQQCVSDCADQCTGTALAPACDLLCACLENSCDGVIPGVLVGQACLDKCATDSLQPGLVGCLRTHCDLGNGLEVHCKHAIGEDPVCLNAIQSTEPRPPPEQCLGLNERGWYCLTDDECCSGDCVGTGACK